MEHILAEIEKNPHLCIYIGTDSQNETKRRRTIYATVVVFRYGTRGAHFVYHKQTVGIIRDRFTRLFGEAEKTIELAEMITGEIPVKIEALEFDYNARKKTESTKVIPAAKGWAESLGYRVNVKPETLLAIRAADHICNHSADYVEGAAKN
jgi:predicted RNase H-related nuclease YkuK (DUF458 family)